MKRSDLVLQSIHSVDEELEDWALTRNPEAISCLEEKILEKPNYPDQHYNVSKLYYIAGQLIKALSHLDEALRINPAFLSAAILKAEILGDQGRLDESLATIEKAEEYLGVNAELCFRKALTLVRMGRRKAAIHEGIRALEVEPNHYEALNLLGEQYICDREWHNAYECFEKTSRQRPDSVYSYLFGLLALKLGHIDTAEMAFQQVLALEPLHLNSMIRLSLINLIKGNYQESYEIMSRAVNSRPNYPDLRYHLSRVCLLMGRRDEASTHMQSALQLNPRYAEVRRELGYLYTLQNRTEYAVKELAKTLEMNPDDEQAYLNLGFLYSNKGEYQSGKTTLEEGLRRYPKSWRLYQSLGIIHLRNKSFNQAKAAFLEAVRINPQLAAQQLSLRINFEDDTLLEEEKRRIEELYTGGQLHPGQMYQELGRLYLDMNRTELAIGQLRNALENDFKPLVSTFLLATAYANMQAFDEAIRALESISGEGNIEWLRLMLLALFEANSGGHHIASRHYQRVMAIAPVLFLSLGRLPVCFRERDELDGVLDDYLDYSRYHDQHSQLLCRIGELTANKGMLVEARRYFHHATVLEPSDRRAYQRLGVLAMLRLDFDWAINMFNRAVDNDPLWPLPYLNLALTHQICGRIAESQAALRRFLDVENDPHWREQGKRMKAQLDSISIDGSNG